MKIGLIPFDSKDMKFIFPNLALMKIAAYHFERGDKVGLLDKISYVPDKIYVSVIFPKNKANALGLKYMYPDSEVVFGGSGMSYDCLPEHIEHLMPKYDIYPDINYSMGFVTRGCVRNCSFCIVRDKEGPLRFNASLKEFVDERFPNLRLLDNNILGWGKCIEVLKEIKDRGLKVDFNQGLDIRLVTNEIAKLLSDLKYYNHHFDKKTLRFSFDHSNLESDIKKGTKLLFDNGVKPKELFFYILAYPDKIQDAVNRVNLIKDLGSRPFIMKINQVSGKEINKLAKWVNHIPYYKVIKWKDFDPNIKTPHKNKHNLIYSNVAKGL